MTTISDIIHEWQLEQVHANSKFPEGFSEATTKALGETVWNLILPVLQEQTGAIEAEAASRIEIEKTCAAKIREAAEEVLAEAKAKEEAITEMQKKVAELMATNAEQLGALREARAMIRQLQAANEELLKRFNEASTAAAACRKTTPNRPLQGGSVFVSFGGSLFLSLDTQSNNYRLKCAAWRTSFAKVDCGK